MTKTGHQPAFHFMMRFTELRSRADLSIEELAQLTGYGIRTIYRWESGETEPRKAVLDLLIKHIEEKKKSDSLIPPKFKFIDLFAGIGGMRLGFEPFGGKCVFTSEWDQNSQKTYSANFPDDDHAISGDITKIDEKDIPAHDVLLAGFPCQPFSIAGVSKKNSMGRKHGFRDETQGTLFFDVACIIAHHKPAAFLLENVKNLASYDKGKTFQVIMKTLKEELGYHVSWRIIDAQNFVPQHRERIFIIGFRKDVGFDLGKMEFPKKKVNLGMILHPEDGSEPMDSPFTVGEKAEVNEKYTLSPKLWQYLQNYAKKHKEKGNGFGFGLFGPEGIARTLSARYYKDGSEILIRQEGKDPRRLTPRECARLMGFDNKKRVFNIPVSDTQAYRQFGNAVVVPVVETVAKYVTPYILQSLESEPVIERKHSAVRQVKTGKLIPAYG
jgi:DNA (cytosine-5)-methyltransferase 1